MRPTILLSMLTFLMLSSASASTTAFVNVNVVPMTSEIVIPAQTVVVTDGVITTIGSAAEIGFAPDTVVVDGTDRYLMPGLAEMHGHVPGNSSDDLQRTLSLYAVNGITTVRGMLGQRAHLQLKIDLSNHKVLGPRLITSGPSLNGRSVNSTAAATGMVEAQHAAGYDFLKIHPGLTREEFDAMAAAANRLGIKFAGHVPEDVGVERALATGMASIDHLDGYMETLMRANVDPSGGVSGLFGVYIADYADESKIPGIAAATARAGVWNVPTESLFEHAASPALDPDDMEHWPEMKYMPRETVERWSASKREILGDANYDPETAVRAIELRHMLIVALHKAGAGLLLGSDSPQIFNVPGFAIHHELEYLVDAGLTPFEALQTGTLNAARYFDTEDQLGTVTEGKIADLLLLDANPLEDITNSKRIHGVMLDGQWLPRQEIEQILAKLKR
jgi:imidazolonepropionase-like amidohydrolase